MSIRPDRLAALACAAAAAVAIAAGCGDDGDSSLSRNDFLAQGNAICATGGERIAAAAPDFSKGPPAGAEAQAFYETIVAETRRQIDELAALEPPQELREDVDALLGQARSAVGEVEAQGPKAFFASQDDPFTGVDARARTIGLTACGS